MDTEKSADSIFPTTANTSGGSGVGIRKPSQGRGGGVLQSGIHVPKPKKKKAKTNRGKSPDALNNGGVTSVSDSGTSMGSKFWSGSPFGN